MNPLAVLAGSGLGPVIIGHQPQQRERRRNGVGNKAEWLPAGLVLSPRCTPEAQRGWAIDQGHHLQHPKYTC